MADGVPPEGARSLLESALDAVADGLVIVDRDGRIRYANRRFAELLGLPPEVAASRDRRTIHDWFVTQVEDPEAYRTRVEALYANPEHEALDTIRLRDGRVLERASYPYRAGGGIVGRLWSFRDVTGRVRAEAGLRESERWLRQVIDLVPHLIFAKDADGRFVLANQAVAEAYGTSVDELIGRTDADFARSDAELARFRHDDLEVIRGGRLVRIPHESLTDAAGRVRSLETIKLPVTLPGPARPGVLGVAIDTTERRQLEAELLQSQRMEAIGRLAGGIAHDFNNLLTAILGFSHAVLEDLPPEDGRRDDLVDIVTAAERAADLTRQLLAFSRRQVLQPRVLSLNDTIRSLERLLRRVIGEDIQLEARLDPRLLRVKADAGQLEQVIVNLAVNAREAMPRGGRLTLETRNLRFISVPSAVRSHGPMTDYVSLRVTDTGQGMDAEVAARVFEPFFTTKEQGTGLGLSTVYGIVKQTGGDIDVFSTPGRGTTFTVYLPATAETPAGGDAAAAGPVPAGDATILLAEDEEAVRRLIKRLLVADGYRVLEAANGEHALEVAGAWEGPIDLLLTDLIMPRMNGRDLAVALRERRPGVRLAFMSGYTADAYGRDTSPLPGAPFLQKPFDGLGLRRLVRTALDQDDDPT
jgi:two-component system, cell cycle sensor histidine kinase and response regulator CckA